MIEVSCAIGCDFVEFYFVELFFFVIVLSEGLIFADELYLFVMSFAAQMISM